MQVPTLRALLANVRLPFHECTELTATTSRLCIAAVNALPELLRVVEAVAKSGPPMDKCMGADECHYCGGYRDEHRDSCAWLAARKLCGG